MQQEQSLGSAVPNSGAAPVSVASQPNESTAAPVARPTYSEDQQTHLNSLIGAAKKEGYEKALRERHEQTGHQAPVQPVPSYVPPHQPVQQPYQAPIDPQVLQQMIDTSTEAKFKEKLQQVQQEFATKRRQEEANELTNNLLPKVNAAREKFADFDKKVDFEAFQGDEWYRNLSQIDNAGEVMYALVDSPSQFTSLELLLNSGNKAKIAMAKNKIQQLSTSMKNNESSASKKVANEPLKDVRPSKVNSSGDVNLTKAAREKYARQF